MTRPHQLLKQKLKEIEGVLKSEYLPEDDKIKILQLRSEYLIAIDLLNHAKNEIHKSKNKGIGKNVVLTRYNIPKEFNSIIECANFLGCHHQTVRNYSKLKKRYKGYKIEIE